MKQLLYVCLLSTGLFFQGNAQELGIGAGVHYLGNGIELSYTKHLNARWHVDAGLRIMVNTPSLYKNKQHKSYYQSGYAMTFPEYFGIDLRVNRSLVQYRAFHLYAMSNLLLTRHSLLERSASVPGSPAIEDRYYSDPALAVELTVGLKAQVALSSKISLNAAAGIGAIWMNYSHTRRSTIDGREVTTKTIGDPFSKKDHGAIDFVGLEGVPALYLGLSYRL